MKVYQVSEKRFFTSDGIEHAAAADMENDVKIFTSVRKAQREFDELVSTHAAMLDATPRKKDRIGWKYQSTEVKNYGIRIIIELACKETNMKEG